MCAIPDAATESPMSSRFHSLSSLIVNVAIYVYVYMCVYVCVCIYVYEICNEFVLNGNIREGVKDVHKNKTLIERERGITIW